MKDKELEKLNKDENINIHKINLLNILNINKDYNKNLINTIENNNNIIKYFYISPALIKFKDKLINEYNLIEFNDKNININNEKILVFGLYRPCDFVFLNKYINTNKIIIMWGGTDAKNIKFNKKINLYKYNNIKHIAISNHIYNLLSNLEFQNIKQVHLRLLNYNNYNNISLNLIKKNVYIYTHIRINHAKETYGYDTYIELIKKMPHINFIIAHGQYSNSEIIDIYKLCFIGIRLTMFDGNANTVQELGLLGLNCIHNGEFPNSLEWNNIDDIIFHINKEFYQNDDKITINNRLNIRENMLSYLDTNNDFLIYD